MKKLLTLLLCAAMILGLGACGGNTSADASISVPEGNLIKIEDFSTGELENLVIDLETGWLSLAEGATEGTYTSPCYSTTTFNRAVASWNCVTFEDSSVEIFAKAKKSDVKEGEEAWTDFGTWGEFSQFKTRGSEEGKRCNGAVIDVDTLCMSSGTGDGLQMKAVLRRDSASDDSPVLRRISMTYTGGETVAAYAEEPVEIPASNLCEAPAYSQEIRHPGLANYICSPTSMSVLLNSRMPELDLLPEELALACMDQAEGLFGNWSFSASIAGNYGFESYVQYADKDILLQELAQGRPVCLSVQYTPKTLPGAYDSTGGHLIAIVGYEYEGGIMDDDHLYFYSSDSYSPDDASSYHKYQWTKLDSCWDGRIAYIVPSLTQETEEICGVVRVPGSLAAAGEDSWVMLDREGNAVDTSDFKGNGGVLAYTVEGIGTDMKTETHDSRYSVVYPAAINVTANNTFFYLTPASDGSFALDKAAILEENGLVEATITVYAITNCGYMYTAELQ